MRRIHASSFVGLTGGQRSQLGHTSLWHRLAMLQRHGEGFITRRSETQKRRRGSQPELLLTENKWETAWCRKAWKAGLYLERLLDNTEVYCINTSLSCDFQTNKQRNPLDAFLFKPSENPDGHVRMNMQFQTWTAGVASATVPGLSEND